jgi:hypothetical protein
MGLPPARRGEEVLPGAQFVRNRRVWLRWRGESEGVEQEGKAAGSVLAQHRVSRRESLKFCSFMAGTLALPARFATRIAHAVGSAMRNRIKKPSDEEVVEKEA